LTITQFSLALERSQNSLALQEAGYVPRLPWLVSFDHFHLKPYRSRRIAVADTFLASAIKEQIPRPSRHSPTSSLA